MILAITSFNCRVKGCSEIWVVANDGSFDQYKEFLSPEKVAQIRRDAHELREHADQQYDEVEYDYDR